jgi:hypothetical protein
MEKLTPPAEVVINSTKLPPLGGDHGAEPCDTDDDLRAQVEQILQDAISPGKSMNVLAEIQPEAGLGSANDVANFQAEEPADLIKKGSFMEELREEEKENNRRRIMPKTEEKEEIPVDETNAFDGADTYQLKEPCTWRSLGDEASFQVGELVEFEYDETWKKGIVTATTPLKVRYLVLADDEGLEYDNVRKLDQADSTVEARVSLKFEESTSDESASLFERPEKTADVAEEPTVTIPVKDENRSLTVFEKAEEVTEDPVITAPEKGEETLLILGETAKEIVEDSCVTAPEKGEDRMLIIREMATDALLAGSESGSLESALAETMELRKTLGDDAILEEFSNKCKEKLQISDRDLRELAKHSLVDGLASGELEAALMKRAAAKEGSQSVDAPLVNKYELEELRRQAKQR